MRHLRIEQKKTEIKKRKFLSTVLSRYSCASNNDFFNDAYIRMYCVRYCASFESFAALNAICSSTFGLRA